MGSTLAFTLRSDPVTARPAVDSIGPGTVSTSDDERRGSVFIGPLQISGTREDVLDVLSRAVVEVEQWTPAEPPMFEVVGAVDVDVDDVVEFDPEAWQAAREARAERRADLAREAEEA